MNANHRALIGGVVWIAFLALTGPQLLHENWAHALLLLAALVLFPLALELTDDPKDPPAAAKLVMAARLLQLPAAFLLAGAFLIERFFSIPGIGREVLLAVERSDFPVIKAVTVYVAVATLFFNLLADVLYKALDPRVQLQ